MLLCTCSIPVELRAMVFQALFGDVIEYMFDKSPVTLLYRVIPLVVTGSAELEYLICPPHAT